MAVDQAFIIQQIRHKEALYAAFCMNTKMPFLICDPETYSDQVWVFDGEEGLKKFVDEYAQKKYVIRGAKIEQKQFAAFFASLYTLDVNELVFVMDGGLTKVALADLVQRPDLSKIPALQRPIENPALQLSGLTFMQEASRQIPNEEKNLQDLNEEFSANLAGARYIVAVIPKEGPGSLAEKLQKHDFAVPVLNMKNGKKFVPCFSDQFEFDKFRRQQKLLELAVPLPGLLQYGSKETDGFMLNPFGMSMVLTRELIEAITKAFPERVQGAIKQAGDLVRQAQEEAASHRQAAEQQAGANRKEPAGQKAGGGHKVEPSKPLPIRHMPGHSKVLTPFAGGPAQRKPEPAPVYRPMKKQEEDPSGQKPQD